jgi:hypothetical protein
VSTKWLVLICPDHPIQKKTLASASALAYIWEKNTSIPDPFQIEAIRETTNFTRVIAPNW